jgi:ABC-type ATPase involved in cell division
MQTIIEDMIKNLSDDDLYQALKKKGLHVGPVVQTTRLLYEKRLLRNILLNMSVIENDSNLYFFR